MQAAKPLRILLAGAGAIGQQHLRCILAEPSTQLAGIVDSNPQIAHQAASLGVPWAADLNTLLTSTHPDALILALPNQFHYPAAITAIKANLPTLLEKPVCETVDQAHHLAQLATAAGVPILVGHHRRHSPRIQAAKQIIDSGQLGRLTSIQATCWLLKSPQYFEGPGIWRTQPGGGIALINLIHTIDDLRNLCGDISSVQAVASSATRGFEVEDSMAILLTFKNGALATLSASDTAAGPWSWELTSGEDQSFPHSDQSCYWISGTKAALSIPQLDLWQNDHWRAPIHVKRTQVPPQDPLVNQLRHFCDVARRLTPPRVDIHTAALTLQTTLAIKQAAATRQPVFLD